MATRRPEKVEELVSEEFKHVITPSGTGDAVKPRLAPDAMPASSSATPTAVEPEHKPDPASLDVWILTSGMKPDQTAGFRRWATARKLGPRIAPEWELVYREFLARPV